MPVSFDELVGSPTINASQESRSATRTGIIAWSDIDPYFLELFPPPSVGIPQLPALWPVGGSDMYAQSVAFSPFHPDDINHSVSCSTTVNQHDNALAVVQYATIPYEQPSASTDQIITRRFSHGGEFLTYRNIGISWSSAPGVPIPDTEVTAGKIVPSLEFVITMHRVTPAYYSSLRTVVDGLIGKVNDAAFEGAAIGSLLFLGGEFRQTVTTDGSEPWQIDLKFSQRLAKNGAQSVGWNYAFREETGQWAQIETTNGDDIYPSGDFTTLY